METVKLIECPRDAMQGIEEFIPTRTKIEYLQGLLEVGFDTVDIGSFVSPKAIPQMRDSGEVLRNLDFSTTTSKILTIVVNERGATDAAEFEVVDYFGYPFSISETFQVRNTNTDIEGSLKRTEAIMEIAKESDKELVIYISMAFGNPYGDEWNKDVATKWVSRLVNELNVGIISLADTVGVAAPDDISYMFDALIPAFPKVEFGAHLHATSMNWESKVQAAWDAGCRRFDGALKGYGGCPMADDALVGNVAMENLHEFFSANRVETGVDADKLKQSLEESSSVFPL